MIRPVENIPDVKIFPRNLIDIQSLGTILPAAIYAIQKRWDFLEKTNADWGHPFNMSLNAYLTQPLQNQKEFIEDFAKSIFFLKTSTRYEKKCCEKGHTIRLNAKKLNLKKAKQLIEKTRLLYEKDPTILAANIYLQQNQRRRRKYDVRVDFTHVDNCPSCCYLPQKIATVEKVSALDVIEIFKKNIQDQQLDLDSEYAKLINLTFKNDLSNSQFK